jgi:DNA-binding NtrC family response regulator
MAKNFGPGNYTGGQPPQRPAGILPGKVRERSFKPDLLASLAGVCEAIVKEEYARAKELFALTVREKSYPPDISFLAEAFGMMLVKVEAGEFTLEKLSAELEAARMEMTRLQAVLPTSDKQPYRHALAGDPSALVAGESPAMQDIVRQIARIAQVKATVLITGETGTGKGLVARALHFNGNRAKGPFVSVNCAAIPETLLESELFGIEKGVASGVTSRIGRFEQADGGTLFLDEIGDLPLDSQAKILHVIENGMVERVGGRQSIPVDVRIIAATHRDLPAMCDAKLFRSDLYYRLNVLRLHIPPLRERREDIPVLVRHFLDKNSLRNPGAVRGITRDALRLLAAHNWPGNIREMENEIERAALLARGSAITPQDLSPILIGGEFPCPYLPDGSPVLPHPAEKPLKRGRLLLREPGADAQRVRSLSEVELDTVRAALSASGGNKAQAARILGITREGFRKMLKRLALP